MLNLRYLDRERVDRYVFSLKKELLAIEVSPEGESESGSVYWDRIESFLAEKLFKNSKEYTELDVGSVEDSGNWNQVTDELVDYVYEMASYFEVYWTFNGNVADLIYILQKLNDR